MQQSKIVKFLSNHKLVYLLSVTYKDYADLMTVQVWPTWSDLV